MFDHKSAGDSVGYVDRVGYYGYWLDGNGHWQNVSLVYLQWRVVIGEASLALFLSSCIERTPFTASDLDEVELFTLWTVGSAGCFTDSRNRFCQAFTVTHTGAMVSAIQFTGSDLVWLRFGDHAPIYGFRQLDARQLFEQVARGQMPLDVYMERILELIRLPVGGALLAAAAGFVGME